MLYSVGGRGCLTTSFFSLPLIFFGVLRAPITHYSQSRKTHLEQSRSSELQQPTHSTALARQSVSWADRLWIIAAIDVDSAGRNALFPNFLRSGAFVLR
jgi:hypothetical protein